MPWRWQRWIWFVAMPLGLAMYFLSAVPVERLIQQRLRPSRSMIVTVRTIYEPASLLCAHFEAAEDVMDWEHELMDRLIGLRPVTFGGFNQISLETPADALDAIAEALE